MFMLMISLMSVTPQNKQTALYALVWLSLKLPLYTRPLTSFLLQVNQQLIMKSNRKTNCFCFSHNLHNNSYTVIKLCLLAQWVRLCSHQITTFRLTWTNCFGAVLTYAQTNQAKSLECGSFQKKKKRFKTAL